MVIDLKQIVFKDMINKLLKNPTAKFMRMKILNVVIDNGIVANCNVNLSQLDQPSDIVKKYLDSISQISLSLGVEANPISIVIYSSGSVVIYRNRDEISDEIMNDISVAIIQKFQQAANHIYADLQQRQKQCTLSAPQE